MTWNYEAADYLSFGGNAAEAAKSVLKDGPIGLHWRPDVAKVFRACGENADLRGIKTSCGVDASACWYWAGRRFSIPRGKMAPHGHIGGVLVGPSGWVEIDTEFWIPADGSARPDVGDILTFGHRLSDTHHVETVMEARDDHTVLTAHGGASPTYGELMHAGIQADHAKIKRSNGTMMKMGAGFKELTGVSGWYSARAFAKAHGL